MRGQPLRLCVLVAAVATSALALTAASVAAAPVQHYHFAFTCTSTPTAPADPNTCLGAGNPFEVGPGPTEIDPELCDIPGTTIDSQSGNVQIFADGTKKVESTETYSFTSALTGKSIESRSHSQATNNMAPIDNGNGTVSFVFTFKGLEQQLKLPNGSLLARDAGPVTFTLTLNATTGDFVSFVVSYKSPHPLIENGLCTVVIPALS